MSGLVCLTVPVRGGDSSNKYCVEVYGSILTRFFGAFFRMDRSFRCTTVLIFVAGGATIFAKLRSKIAKSPKIGGKVCAHHFVQIAERFEENSTAVV